MRHQMGLAPKDVQETMNKVVKAENEKIAAVDFATASETQSDGEKRSAIKRAEPLRRARCSPEPSKSSTTRPVP